MSECEAVLGVSARYIGIGDAVRGFVRQLLLCTTNVGWKKKGSFLRRSNARNGRTDGDIVAVLLKALLGFCFWLPFPIGESQRQTPFGENKSLFLFRGTDGMIVEVSEHPSASGAMDAMPTEMDCDVRERFKRFVDGDKDFFLLLLPQKPHDDRRSRRLRCHSIREKDAAKTTSAEKRSSDRRSTKRGRR